MNLLKVKRIVSCLVLLFLSILEGNPLANAPNLPSRTYYTYVCAESEDEVAIVRFGPDGLAVVKTVIVGNYPAEIEGPHGIQVGPNGDYWYVSMAHGFPFGSVHKYKTETDEWVGDVELGMYPATIDIAASTRLFYVVNFDLHGPLEPGTISVVEAETMSEIARFESGIRPHGGRLNRDGSKFYAVNVMGFELVEVDALAFEVSRRLFLGDGVQPSWVTKPTDSGHVYVTGNNVSKIFEVDLDSWSITRQLDAGSGPYNLALTPDGETLVVTYKMGNSVGFWNLRSGQEMARVKTSGNIPHGVIVTPDGEYAFVTLEGIGGEPGIVEVYHVNSMQRVGEVAVGKQAGGIAFWKIEEKFQ